jgi:HEAT repeat protein
MKKLQILCVLVAGFVAAPAMAQSPQDMALLTPDLASIDTLPTKASLDASFESPAAVLMTAARDSNLSLYERKRAISLLSLYPSPQAQVFLGSMSKDSNPEIRGMAVYTVARAFGPIANDQTFEIIEKALLDPELDVKIWALRGLRWVSSERAERLLIDWQENSDPRLAKVAKSATRKRLRASMR